MPEDDIELLRLRAKAKLKLQQQTPQQVQSENLSDAFIQPGQKAQEAAQSFQRGDIPAGIFGGANAGLQAATELTGLPTAVRALKQIPTVGGFNVGQGLEGVLNLIPNAISYGSGLIDRGLQKIGVPENVRTMGDRKSTRLNSSHRT